MKKGIFKKVLSLSLAAIMAITVVPLSAIAATDKKVPASMTSISSVNSKLAPGVEQSVNTVYDKDGNRVVYYTATADLSVDTVDVYANYKDNQNSVYGMSKVTEQVAAAEAKHASEENYSVVAAMNASYYNMTTGKPTGTFVMEGNDVTNESEGNAYPFFAILKDGTAMIGQKNDYSKYKGQIAEAIGGWTMLVWNGEIVSGTDASTKYPRSTIGVTADGKVVFMNSDGHQAPYSSGLTKYEQAEIMQSMGCVAAVELDGGGSATYGCKPEGENDFRIISRPSDGSERSVSNSVMIVSRAASDGVFDRAVVSVSDEYITPNSSVEVTASGVDGAGNSAPIPADISWQLADSSMGTIENGTFVSAGKAGDAVIQMVYAGNVVGEATVHVVIPDKLTFESESITVPFGKTVDLAITATYGPNEVKINNDDINFTLADSSVGTVNGLSFTAAEEGGATTSALTAVLAADSSVTASATITLGKASEVLFDFEDGTTNGFGLSYSGFNYYLPNSKVSVADKKTGKVHSGNNSLALNIDYSNSLESGYQMIALYRFGEDITFENAKRLGMWIYIPDEYKALWARWTTYPIESVNEDGTYTFGSRITGQTVDGTINGQTGYVSSFEESGWHYLSIDLSAYKGSAIRSGYYLMEFYISDRDGAAYNYYFKNQHNLNGDFTLYVDDITVDYSDAIDDRDAPIFDKVTYADGTMSDAAVLNGQTVTSNTVSFGASVKENVANSNFTGLDASTAKAYVDGVEVNCSYSGGIMSAADVKLADGLHKVKFTICDKAGNYASIIRKINVQAAPQLPTVKLVAHDKSLDRIKLGSIYYADLVATDIEKIQSVSVDLDLDNMSDWQLDHMNVAKGFKAEYTLEKAENIATITVTRTGESDATGEAPLVSIPIRAWELSNPVTVGNKTYDYATFHNSKECWPIAIDVTVDRGLITFTDGTQDTFTGENLIVDTEMWANYGNMVATAEGKAYFDSWDGGHIHSAQPVEDKAATCTEAGYTGRTFCNGCNSVINWGETIEAKGHSYKIIDGVYKCSECGTKNDYTGFIKENGSSYYAVAGSLVTGWRYIDGTYYYFEPSSMAAVTGDYTLYLGDMVTYVFDENGALTSGVWVTSENGSRYYYGPSRYIKTWADINGERYYFDENGYRKEGYNYLIASAGNEPEWYEFTNEGVLVRKLTESGLIKIDGKLYYLENGNSKHGLIKAEDGNYYYFSTSNYAAVSGKYWVGYTNDTGFEPGYYNFDETTCAMIDESNLNGLVQREDGLYYYVDGAPVYAGLIEVDGAYYYINSSLKAVTGRYWVAKNNDLLPQAYYEFGPDGKMIVEESKGDGIVVEEDGTYYYVDGVKTYAGLVYVDGEYYYFNSSLKAVTGRYWVAKNNDLLPQGYYEFGADGKMIIEKPKGEGLVVEEDGTYYYVNGAKTYAGLVCVDGDYYYFNSGLKAVTGRYWVAKNNDLLPQGYYEFGPDGKMIVS